MDIMKPIEIIRFQAAEARSTPEGVTGIVLPFNVEIDRPGFDVDSDGNLAFWDTREYDSHAFDWQMGALNDGKRPFMWEHGAVGGMMSLSSIPIGNVTQMQALPTEMRFEALFNNTTVSQQIRQVVGVTAIEVSAAVVTEEFALDKRRNPNRLVQRVTRGNFKHVSLVVHGEFPQAKLVSVFCAGCNSYRSPVANSDHTSNAVNRHIVLAEREHNARSGDVVEVSAHDLGALHARINDLEHDIKVAQTNAILDKIQ